MPRVSEKKARRDYPDQQIVKGDTYYTWSFYRGPKMRSRTRPKPSRLTQRDELIFMLEAQELFDGLKWAEGERERLAEACRDAAGLMEEAANAAREKYDNLPENFQNSERGESLESFASECEDAQSELEALGGQLEDEDTSFAECGTLEDLSWPSEF